jgi:mono/diheme cytochrome c family protein
MRTIRIVLLASAWNVCAWAGDAQHGAVVAAREGCLECHAVGGQGAGHETPVGGPDLAQNPMPGYAPSALASALWNHTPAMWRQMAEREAGRPEVTRAEWEDVFAWLYSLQFSQKPAEVGRGKLAFESKECSSCHSPDALAGGPGKPVSAWEPLDDPVVLVYQLWNHASIMGTEFTKRKTPWPIMTGRDFTDLTAYLQNVQKRIPDTHFSLPEAAVGQSTFAEKCQPCHTGPMALENQALENQALENRANNQSWMDLGAAMWNHAPSMKPPSTLTQDEMRKILAFVWERQYQGARGNQAAGQRVFENAGCVNCHRSPGNGAPMRPPSRDQFTRDQFTPWSMVALGWGQGRTMHQQMLERGIAWPDLTPANMNDLVAYLNSLPQQ